VADDNSGLMAEFEEFLNAKAQKQAAESQDEDYDVEIWDEKGKGARVRRSHAKPFLQSLGIDLDPEPDPNSGDKGGDGKGGDTSKSNRTSTGRQSTSNATSGSTGVRKYFTKPAGK
jgi:hypothetical protein